MTSSTGLAAVSDYLLWYAKDKEQVKYNQLYVEWDERTPDPLLKSYIQVELPDGTRRRMSQEERENPAFLPEGSRRFQDISLTSQGAGIVPPPYEFKGLLFYSTGGRSWGTTHEGLSRLAKQERLIGRRNALRCIRYAGDLPGRAITNIWTDTIGGGSGKTYVVETNPKVIQRCVLMTTDPGDLVLDPTCGSGTTAFVAEQWGGVG